MSTSGKNLSSDNVSSIIRSLSLYPRLDTKSQEAVNKLLAYIIEGNYKLVLYRTDFEFIQRFSNILDHLKTYLPDLYTQNIESFIKDLINEISVYPGIISWLQNPKLLVHLKSIFGIDHLMVINKIMDMQEEINNHGLGMALYNECREMWNSSEPNLVLDYYNKKKYADLFPAVKKSFFKQYFTFILSNLLQTWHQIAYDEQRDYKLLDLSEVESQENSKSDFMELYNPLKELYLMQQKRLHSIQELIGFYKYNNVTFCELSLELCDDIFILMTRELDRYQEHEFFPHYEVFATIGDYLKITDKWKPGLVDIRLLEWISNQAYKNKESDENARK